MANPGPLKRSSLWRDTEDGWVVDNDTDFDLKIKRRRKSPSLSCGGSARKALEGGSMARIQERIKTMFDELDLLIRAEKINHRVMVSSA